MKTDKSYVGVHVVIVHIRNWIVNIQSYKTVGRKNNRQNLGNVQKYIQVAYLLGPYSVLSFPHLQQLNWA